MTKQARNVTNQQIHDDPMLSGLDDLTADDPALGTSLSLYGETSDYSKKTLHWQRAYRWIENILFSSGRHYLNDLFMNKIIQSGATPDNLSLIRDTAKNIPRPTNDILGRYVETNVAVLTENRPRPRVTAKSDKSEDEKAAELSEIALEYMWEALDMPQKHRQLARMIIHCGTAWMEIGYDPAQPRRMSVPETHDVNKVVVPSGTPGAPPLELPILHSAPKLDEKGRGIYSSQVEYGDITANIISPFEMYLPPVHWWKGSIQSVDEAGWVIREYQAPLKAIREKYEAARASDKATFSPKNGWYIDRLQKAASAQQVWNYPVWWWERLGQLVEGAGESFFLGNPQMWSDYVPVRVYDRKPCLKWPRGRTVIVAGGQVIYASPKEVGARAYDPRWPDRWHPYTIFRWEPMASTDIYCRSLVSKLLPKIKRINAIDTTLIMYRRTVPIASVVAPKGTQVVEGSWQGGYGGVVFEYDPRRTAAAKPEVFFPPPFPEAILVERSQQMAEIESIAGTEEILRGQRPEGTTSASQLEMLRRQALASRSGTLHAWDEALESEGSAILQELIRNVKEDKRYAERLRILAREKASLLAIETFSGTDLSDNVTVRVDTVSMAFSSKEARQLKALEFLQTAANLDKIPYPGLREALIKELGYETSLNPQGLDVARVKQLIAWIKQGRYDRIMPMADDDPMVFYEYLVAELKKEAFWDLDEIQQQLLIALKNEYKKIIEFRQSQQMQLQMAMQQATKGQAPQQQPGAEEKPKEGQ